MTRGGPHPYLGTLKSLLAARRIDRRVFLRHATLLGLSGAAAYGLVEQLTGTAISQPAQASLPYGGSLRIAMRVPDLSRPHSYAWIEPEIARQVVPTLTKTGPDSITRPHLLESWEASDDLRSWTLRLRSDLRWRKGRSLTAEQVAWNLRRVLDSSTNSPALGLMAPYMLDLVDTGRFDDSGAPIRERGLWDANAIEVVDDRTLRLNTRLSQVAVPQHLQHGALGILDPEEDGVFGPGSNGLGAFELVEVEPGKRALLKAVNGHWAEQGPFLDTVQFIDLGDDAEAAIAALAGRQVDGIYRVELGQLDRLRAIEHVQLYETSSAMTAVARMKVAEPPFTDRRVRKAMRLAIDCERVRKAALGTHGLAGEHHHVCPVQQDYVELPSMVRDVEAARSLLAEAGFPHGLKCEILVKDDAGWELAAIEEMQAQWQEAGIKVRIRKVSWNLYWELWNKVAFGFTNWAHDSLGTINLGLAYRGGAPWNESGYANPEFDRLLDLAEATLDLEARRKTMSEIEKLMQEDGPIVQPLWAPVFAAYDRRVKGVELYPSRSLFADELAVEG
jgi:peptide/nickel transport system substrate-binding protein